MLSAKVSEISEKAKAAKFAAEKIDVTEPGRSISVGVKHPITQTINEVVEIFRSMGYTVYEGPDIDTVYNTFDALNSPENHPARDLTDTFYISDDVVLRPHTSSAEIRAEKELPLPYKVLIPGRCYRVDTPDATHSPTFHQIEMMVIGERYHHGRPEGVFGPYGKRNCSDRKPEPNSVRVISRLQNRAQRWMCPASNAAARAAPVCKGSGWIEILGSRYDTPACTSGRRHRYRKNIPVLP